MNFANIVVKNPIRSYLKGASLGFGYTLSSNYIFSASINNPPINMYREPQTFALLAVSKSLYFGSLFPIIPIMMVTRPAEFFIVGGSWLKE